MSRLFKRKGKQKQSIKISPPPSSTSSLKTPGWSDLQESMDVNLFNDPTNFFDDRSVSVGQEGWRQFDGVWVTDDFIPTVHKTRFPPKYTSTDVIVKRDKDLAKESVLNTLQEMDAKMLIASLRHENTMLEARPIYTKDIYGNIVFTLVIITNILDTSYNIYIRHWLKINPEFSFGGNDLFFLFKKAKYEITENW